MSNVWEELFSAFEDLVNHGVNFSYEGLFVHLADEGAEHWDGFQGDVLLELVIEELLLHALDQEIEAFLLLTGRDKLRQESKSRQSSQLLSSLGLQKGHEVCLVECFLANDESKDRLAILLEQIGFH